jgi:molecular chaperone DnaJ
MAKRDYYEVLELPRDATDPDIKKAFRKAAMAHHPDRNPGDKAAEERFKECAEAYEVLSDAQKRARYDRFGHSAFEGGGGPSAGNYGSMDDLFSHFGDLFGDIFGGSRGRGGPRNRPARGSDLRYDLGLRLEEAVSGVRKEIVIPRLESCEPCHGTGAKEGSKAESCGQCQGRGQVAHSQGPFLFTVTCPSCQGEGRILRPADRCGTCGGAGQKRVERKVAVKVPPGVDTGTRLRISGEGEKGERGGPLGDLYVVLSVEPHDTFQRNGDDLHCEVDVHVVQAVLGATIDVPLVDSGTEAVKLPAGIQPGEQVRIRGKGVPHLGGSGRGDLFAHVRVVVPRKLSAEQRDLFEKLQNTLG